MHPAVILPPIPPLSPGDGSVSSQTFKNRGKHLLTFAPSIVKKGSAVAIRVLGWRKSNSSTLNGAIGIAVIVKLNPGSLFDELVLTLVTPV